MTSKERANKLFEELTGIAFEDHPVWGLFARFNDEMDVEKVLPSRKEIEGRLDALPDQSRCHPILADCDGVIVLLGE